MCAPTMKEKKEGEKKKKKGHVSHTMQCEMRAVNALSQLEYRCYDLH